MDLLMGSGPPMLPPVAGCGAARLTFEVKDGKITGSGATAGRTIGLSGHVNPDGTAVMSFVGAGGDYPLKFSTNFEMRYTAGGCERSYKGSRSP
jgi:hypothetical protein